MEIPVDNMPWFRRGGRPSVCNRPATAAQRMPDGRKALDYTVESRAARNRTVFRQEFQLCPCHTAEEPYNLRESGLKKEIPDYRSSARCAWTTRCPLMH